MTTAEVEQLKQQLSQKIGEVKSIYDKLMEAGVVPLSDDFLDTFSGGGGGSPLPTSFVPPPPPPPPDTIVIPLRP